MTTVRQLLDGKPHRLLSVSPTATVYTALERMADYDVGALVVLSEGHLVGIFSERDYARRGILTGKMSRETLVEELMTDRVLCVHPGETIAGCMSLMTQGRVRHLPVIDHGDLVGLVSIGDVVKALISDQQFVITQLERYIHSPGVVWN
ncbi:MAG: CBS domain-containing protein [Vicinamibacterales bacterium]|nr:CBS domain-containing protein [Acidobacteriota bacterium]